MLGSWSIIIDFEKNGHIFQFYELQLNITNRKFAYPETLLCPGLQGEGSPFAKIWVKKVFDKEGGWVQKVHSFWILLPLTNPGYGPDHDHYETYNYCVSYQFSVTKLTFLSKFLIADTTFKTAFWLSRETLNVRVLVYTCESGL